MSNENMKNRKQVTSDNRETFIPRWHEQTMSPYALNGDHLSVSYMSYVRNVETNTDNGN
ncbi:MAG: hypothetical protein BroJett041_21100 [Candidatus Jettenia caeni]|nr:MAG: hypothetical protein BroJett041_21100 [Candidatus Jettenia caeni]GJQ44490.1 MAG: hypothetical protein JETCAE04_02440 [Candidatus Jettenia caeni]